MNYRSFARSKNVRSLRFAGSVIGLTLLLGCAAPEAGLNRLKATNYLGSAGTRPPHVLKYEGQPKATASWWHSDTYRIEMRDSNHQVVFDGPPQALSQLAALPKDLAYVRVWNRRPGYMGDSVVLRIENP